MLSPYLLLELISFYLSARFQNYLVITLLFRLILEGHIFHYVAVHIRYIQPGGQSQTLNSFMFSITQVKRMHWQFTPPWNFCEVLL